MAKLSNYTGKLLLTEARSRYIQKLELINNVDPFEIDKAPQISANFHWWTLVAVSSLHSSIRHTGQWKRITQLLVNGSRMCVHTVHG